MKTQLTQEDTQFVRNYIRRRVESSLPLGKQTLQEMRAQSWSSRFEALMRTRLVLGCARYEDWSTKIKKRATIGSDLYDYVPDMIRRLELYAQTGNDELLVDIANMAMLEFEFGGHPDKHFESKDDTQHVPLRSSTTLT